MSKVGSAETTCPCGAEVKVKVVKPSLVRTGVSTAACGTCKSKFIILADLVGSPRQLQVKFEVAYLSQAARDAMKSA